MTDSPRLNKKQTKGELTKSRIIEVARTLFFEQGYDATSTSQIANQLGLSEAALYKHFKGKKEMLLATVKPKRNQEEDIIFYKSLSNKELLVQWISNMAEVVFSNRAQYSILFNESQKHPELSEDYVRYVYKESRIDNEILERLKKTATPEIDLILLQVGLTGSLLAMLKHKEIHKPELNLQAVPEDIKRMLLIMIEGKLF